MMAALIGNKTMMIARSSRKFSTSKKALHLTPESVAKERAHHEKAALLWKKVVIFVALPSVVIGSLKTYLDHKNHRPKRPPFIAYEHLRVRRKKYFWGDGVKTFFHHPYYNALPDGYETPDDYYDR